MHLEQNTFVTFALAIPAGLLIHDAILALCALITRKRAQ